MASINESPRGAQCLCVWFYTVSPWVPGAIGFNIFPFFHGVSLFSSWHPIRALLGMSSDSELPEPASPRTATPALQSDSIPADPLQVTTSPHSFFPRTIASDANLIPVECRLTGEENYSIWSFIIEHVLRREGLWRYIKEEWPSVVRQSPKERSNR